MSNNKSKAERISEQHNMGSNYFQSKHPQLERISLEIQLSILSVLEQIANKLGELK